MHFQVFNGIASPGEALSQDQQEILEKNGYSFMVGEGMLSRHVNGMGISIRIMQLLRGDLHDARWGIVAASEGEFIVCDIPVHQMIPLTPTLCLMSEASGTISKRNLAEINTSVREHCEAYYFARDLLACPFT